MQLAIFDLDNTLIGGDSDSLWTRFLVEEGILGPEAEEMDRKFYADYEAGELDMMAFLAFQLRPFGQFPMEQLFQWRERFVDKKVRPLLLPKALDLVGGHRARGHRMLIITATNRFVTEPISKLFGIDDLLATEVETVNGRFTGKPAGVPSFREGKIVRLREWLDRQEAEPSETWFYSDSHNDIPLLEGVTHPAAVDPDPLLAEHAALKGWPVLSLR